MSIISSGPLGKVKGRCGGVNFRQENGKTIMSSRPATIKISQSEASVKNRGDFYVCAKACKAVREIRVLYNLWKSSKGKGRTVLNKQLSVNRSRVKTFEDLDKLVLVPAENYTEVSLQSFTAETPALKITVNPIPGSKFFGRASVSAQGILYLSGAKEENDAPFQFIALTSVMSEIALNQPQSFELEPPQWLALTSYTTGKFILNLVIYNKMGDAVEASVNLVGEISF